MIILRLMTFLVFVLFPLSFSSAETVGGQKPLSFSVLPYRLPTEIHMRFDPLADYLSKKIGQLVKIVISADHEEQIEIMGEEKIDFAYTGPAPYVKMVQKYGKKVILGRMETNGKPTYHGIIFVAKNSPIRSLADLRGKRFAFGDHNSTMSHLVPVYMLWKAGVTVDKLKKYEFMGKPANVALGVLSGDFDAGAMLSEMFPQYEKRGLKALMKTPEYSEFVFIASNKLPKKTAQALRLALFELKNSTEGRAILSAIKEDATGIVPANDKDYDNLREVLHQLERLGIK